MVLLLGDTITKLRNIKNIHLPGTHVSSQDIVRQSQIHCGVKIRPEEGDPEIGLPP